MMSYWRSAITWLATSSGLYDCTPESGAEIEKRSIPPRRRQTSSSLPKLKTASLTDPSSDSKENVNSNTPKLYSPNTSFSPTILIPGVVNTPVMLVGPSLSVNESSGTLRRRVRSTSNIASEKRKEESASADDHNSDSDRDPEKSRHLARRVTFTTTEDSLWQDMVHEARFGWLDVYARMTERRIRSTNDSRFLF